MRKLDARKLAREKSLFRYSSALERADFDTVTAVLREAESDPVLAQMIEEINMVYERETIRLSPSLNHSSNHHQKELLMTTIVLPRRQSAMQRWMPVTLAAACVAVLLIGALLMRPLRPNGTFEAGLQTGATNTPTAAASPTMIPTTLPTFTPTPVAMVESTALPPTVIPPDVQSSASAVGSAVCGGVKIISEDTLVHAQPSNNSVAIGRIPAGTKAETLATGLAAEEDTSVPQTQWFFIKADVSGNSVQGWVSANIAQPIDPANPCPSDVVAVGAVVPTLIPANPISIGTQLPTIVPPALSVAAVPTCSPITVDGTTLHVVNQVDKAATIYAAPLTTNSNASISGELPAKGEAILLYQQYDRQSDPIGALWYLIMTGEGENQVTGWVSANSITASESCVTLSSDTIGTAVTIAPAQLSPITGIAMTSSTQTGTCRVTNLNSQPATVFAAPLTADSNAPVVGTFPAQGDAVVIFQNYDQQSAPVGALWYLVSVTGVNQPAITGWVSANSINSTNGCAPEQLVGVSISPVTISTGEVNAVAVPSVAMSKPSMCQISNTSGKAVTMFAAPLTANSNAPAVGEFPVGGEAILILQNNDQSSNPVGSLWYLITLTNSGDKQLTGWISSNDIKLPESCAPQVGAISVPVPMQAAAQADVAVEPPTNTTGAPVNCLVNTYNNESVPVFADPNKSLVINNLPPDMPATVLYQQVDPRTNLSWYLILVVSKEGKQVSGWVSSDSVSIDTTHCPQKP